jgi:hypothetical protein
MDHWRAGRRLGQAGRLFAIELQQDTIAEDVVDVIGGDESMAARPHVILDHDPIEHVLLLVAKNARHVPNLHAVRAEDRGSVIEREV